MDRVAIDIMGPFPVSDNGNKYVMVVGDTITKWIEAYAIPDQTAGTVAEKFVNEFISFVLNKCVFLRCLQVKITKTTVAVFPRGSKKRKSNNDDKHDYGQEKRRPPIFV